MDEIDVDATRDYLAWVQEKLDSDEVAELVGLERGARPDAWQELNRATARLRLATMSRELDRLEDGSPLSPLQSLRLRRELEEIRSRYPQPLGFDEFLADHPEIAGARIGERSAYRLASDAGLDPVEDGEFVCWGLGDVSRRVLYDVDHVTLDHVLDALSRGCKKHGGPITGRQVGQQLWGPDAITDHARRLGSVLYQEARRSARIVIDRSSKPNRYALA